MWGYAKQTQVDALVGTITLLRERIEKLEANVTPTKTMGKGSGTTYDANGNIISSGTLLGSRSWRPIRAMAEEQSLLDAAVQPDSAAILEKRIEEKNA